MLLLGIDTSGKTASAALFDTESGIFAAQSTLYTQKTHSQVIMPMCRDIIAQAGKKMTDIGVVAVANGPGSYTGLRIGAAAVKAMCYALGIKCCGVSTLEGLASNNLAFKGLICPVMKARGELVYAGIYKSNVGVLRKLAEDRIIEKEKFFEEISDYGEQILLCGDGAYEFLQEHYAEEFELAPQNSMIQNAAGICLAALNKNFVMPEMLEVSYLQKVKAEKDLENRAGSKKIMQK